MNKLYGFKTKYERLKLFDTVVNIVKTTEKSAIGFVNICSYLSDNCDELFRTYMIVCI